MTVGRNARPCGAVEPGLLAILPLLGGQTLTSKQFPDQRARAPAELFRSQSLNPSVAGRLVGGPVLAGTAAQEVEVRALGGLEHVIEVELSVAARERDRGRRPPRPSPRELLVRDVECEAPARDVELDLIAVLDQCQRAADR